MWLEAGMRSTREATDQKQTRETMFQIGENCGTLSLLSLTFSRENVLPDHL